MSTRQTKLALVDDAPERIFVKNHNYSLDGKEWLPGVTSILRIQDALGGSDGLVRWAVNLAAKAAFDTAIRPDSPDFDTALTAAIRATEEPRNKGSRVHEGIDAAATGRDHVPNPADGALWYQFSRALLAHKIQIVASEQYVIGQGFGGTYDLDCIIDGRRCLVDTKTGKLKDSFALQLAAYSSAQWQAPKATDGYPVTPLPKFEAFYVLMLADDGYRLIEQEVGPAEIQHFQFLVQTHATLHAWSRKAA